MHCHRHEHFFLCICKGVSYPIQESRSCPWILKFTFLREYEEREYAFDLDFYADVIPEVSIASCQVP